MPQNQMKYLKLATPKSHPFFPMESTIKALPTFPLTPSLSWPTLVLPGVALCGMPTLLLVRNCE